MVDVRVRHLFRCQRNGLLPDGLHGHVQLTLEHHLHVVFNDVRLNRTTTIREELQRKLQYFITFFCDAYLPNDDDVEVQLTARLQQVGEVRGRLRSGSGGALTLAAEQRARRRRRLRLPPFGVGAPAAQEVEISAGRRGADDLHTQAASR